MESNIMTRGWTFFAAATLAATSLATPALSAEERKVSNKVCNSTIGGDNIMTNFRQLRAAAAGLALLGAGLMPGPTLADIVHSDDVIIKFGVEGEGNLCVGFLCADGEFFGSDTIRLKQSSLRIHFLDSSGAEGMPTNDWRIIINDLNRDEADYFAIEDSTAGRQVFRIESIRSRTPGQDHCASGLRSCSVRRGPFHCRGDVPGRRCWGACL